MRALRIAEDLRGSVPIIGNGAQVELEFAQHRLQQVHRPPLHDLEAALVKEVDDDRNRQREHAAEEREVEEGHGRRFSSMTNDE